MEVDSIDVTGDAKWPTGFWTQYTTLTRRSFVLSKDRFLSLLNLINVANMVFIGLVWFRLPRSENTMTDRLALVSYLDGLSTSPIELDLLIRKISGRLQGCRDPF